MHTPGHPLFDQGLADIIAKKSSGAAAETPSPKPPAGDGPDAAPKGRVKRAAAGPASGEEGAPQSALAAKFASLD
eukprot:5155941-Pyramimonas_sp.AAC.1